MNLTRTDDPSRTLWKFCCSFAFFDNHSFSFLCSHSVIIILNKIISSTWVLFFLSWLSFLLFSLLCKESFIGYFCLLCFQSHPCLRWDFGLPIRIIPFAFSLPEIDQSGLMMPARIYFVQDSFPFIELTEILQTGARHLFLHIYVVWNAKHSAKVVFLPPQSPKALDRKLLWKAWCSACWIPGDMSGCLAVFRLESRASGKTVCYIYSNWCGNTFHFFSLCKISNNSILNCQIPVG